MREDVKQSCVKKEIKKALDQFVHKKRDAKDHYFENPDDWTRNALHTQINGTKEEAIEKAKIKVEKEAIYTQNKSERQHSSKAGLKATLNKSVQMK